MTETVVSKIDEPAGQTIVADLRAWLVERALPLWSTTGWDSAHGGFVERLRADGSADLAAPRRVLVQARQVYSFAKAAQMEWFADGKQIALTGLEYMLSKSRSPDGRGYVHLLNQDGSVAEW